MLPPLEKTRKHNSTTTSTDHTSLTRAGSSPSQKTERHHAVPRSSPPSDGSKFVFKPYETNVVAKKTTEDRPPSKTTTLLTEEGRKSASEMRAPSRKSTPTVVSSSDKVNSQSSSSSSETSDKSATPPQDTTSPIIRSGLEILQGNQKDLPLGAYKPGTLPPGIAGLKSLSALCSGCPPGLDPSNPAFRPPFAGGPFSHHHAALLGAGYSPSAPGPYVSYVRVQTPAGGEALVPVCKDPYCTGCQFSMHNPNMLVGNTSTCPSGCTQCDHQKYGLAAAALSMLPPGLPPSLSPYAQLGRPYVCSWMVGDAYCGKRFTTPDELLQHLRTHTNSTGSGGEPATTSSSSSSSVTSLLNSHSLYSSAALHRAAAAAAGYPNPPLSPLSASRYHPYSKPGLTGALGASAFSAFNPTALGPYYSPYSMYGQRIGAAVHP